MASTLIEMHSSQIYYIRAVLVVLVVVVVVVLIKLVGPTDAVCFSI